MEAAGSKGTAAGREWWKPRPEERAVLCGRGDVVLARRWVFGGAMVCAAAEVAMALAVASGRSLPGAAWAADWRWMLASAALILGLGVLVRRRKPWASMGLLVLLTAGIGVPTVAAWRMPGVHWHDHPAYWACRVAVSLLAWAIWSRVLYVTYRLERRAAEGGA